MKGISTKMIILLLMTVTGLMAAATVDCSALTGDALSLCGYGVCATYE